MATSKAQNAPVSANGRSNANDKNGAIKVVMPDANGDFTAPIAKGAIEKVQVVDVDMVLQLKDGTSMVLAGGAISAMDAGHTEVKFSDGLQGLSNLLDRVGTIAIPKLDPILSSLQGQGQAQGDGVNTPNSPEASGLSASVTSQIVNQLTQIVQVNSQSATIKTVDPTAQVAVLSQNTKTGDVSSQPLQHVEPPIPPERPGVIPQEHIIGPDKPAMALSLVNLTTITQIGNVLYGSGGTPVSAIDSSNATQFASQVINAPANATEIHAISNIPANNFIKVIDITLTGNGIEQSIFVKGVPAGMSIANGTDMGGGVWSIPVVPGQRDYGVQLEYTTTLANPSAPIHQNFSLEFDVTMTTATGIVELSQVKQFVIKDVNTANDLTYIDSTTGESVYVLPAQGNSHIIHAGDGGVTIYGSNAADFLFGGAGVDTIHGGSGNTYFEGGAGADQLIGGVGVNTAGYTLSATGVTVDLVSGTGTGGDAQGDTLTNIQNVIGSTHNDTIVSGVAANNINGGGGVDTVSYAGSGAGVIVDLAGGTGSGGNAAGDKLTGIQNVIGSAHNDTFLASTATNAFEGGGHDLNGVDTVSYAGDTSGTGVTVDLSTGVRTGGAAAGDTYSNIQNIVGTSFNDTFIDGAGANRYDGGIGGQDTVNYVDSTTGVNVNFVTGRGTGGFAEGDSYVNVQNVIGSAHDDTFTAGNDSKSFNGGSGGFDTVSYAGAASGVIIDAAAGLGHGAAEGNSYTNIQKFIGGGSNDTFIASTAANAFDGGIAGSDTVDYSNSAAAVTVDLFFTDGTGTSGGYAAGDVLANIANVKGGAGDDVFLANAAQNSFEGGGGNNTVSYEHSTSGSGLGVTVDLSSTNGSGTGGNFALGDKFSNIQNVIGSIFDDTFVASSVANKFTGFGGSDTVSYANSTSVDAVGVTVDLSTVDGTALGIGHGTGDFAEGDTYIAVQNAIGSIYNDTFIAGSLANTFTGGGGSDTVSYAQSTVAVNVDLVNGVGTGGYAEGDKYIGIQNVIGSALDDVIIDSLAANVIDGGTTSLHNRVSYANSVSTPGVAAGVTVDLTHTDGTNTIGGYASGDKLSNIQDLTGSAADDTFFASLAANNLDGGASTASSHNRVSYQGTNTAVNVDLLNGVGTGGYAQGDTYTNIQDVTGSLADDTIIDNAAANYIDGGLGTLHNRVSYANSVTSAGAAAGVTVDLNNVDGTGTSGGYAAGDHLVNIQDLTGSAADDTFVASAAANFLDGGTSDANSHNRVSYLASNDGAATPLPVGVTVDLVAGTGTGGYAQGDTYANIQDVTGSNANDLIVASLASNHLDGAGGVDTVSYASALNGVGVTVDLFTGLGSGVGSFAENDTYANIENVTGTQYSDTFYATLAANAFIGGGGAGVDTVNYSHANDGNGIMVDLINGVGTGGFAQGDTYTGIQNVTGTLNNDTFYGNNLANAFVGIGGVDTVRYDTSGAVTIDFSPVSGIGTGTGGLAQGDTYVGIRNVFGGLFDDTFTANSTVSLATSNAFDGGLGTLHNRVSYAGTGNAVTVNLVTGQGTVGAVGDTYANIQDVTGTALDDIIDASAAANFLDGGTSNANSHNQVNYLASVDGLGVAVGVNVDLVAGTGTGGYAQGDTYTNIQDVTGSNANDLIVASLASNHLDGAGGVDTVSYASALNGIGVTVDLFAGLGSGAGSFAENDTYANIENVTGTQYSDTFYATLAANAFIGGGGAGVDTVNYSHANDGNGITVDLINGVGTGGFAQGDTYTGIQNATGTVNNDTFYGNNLANAFVGFGGVDTVRYDTSGEVTIDFSPVSGIGTGTGGLAQGDTYVGIRNVFGSLFDDTFTANSTVSLATSNAFDGNLGTLHNRVSYAGTGTAVTVNLATGQGTVGAVGDTYANIQDVTGTLLDDTIFASLAANNIDGGGGTTHNRVNYSASVDGLGAAAGVIVDLNVTTGVGTSGGYAAGDKLSNIQDITGSGADDLFVASLAANSFDGGVSTAASHNRVSYAQSAAGVIVDLSVTDGSGTSGGSAAGDTFINIQDITGSGQNDTFVASTANNNFDGSGGSDTVSYAKVVGATGVTVDLFTGGLATAGAAAGDTYTSIENVIGTANNDTFVDGGGAVPNMYTGNGGVDTIDYEHSDVGVTVNFGNGINGTGLLGYAAGDVYVGMRNVLGSLFDDTFFASSDTALATANRFDGNTGTLHNRVNYSTTLTGVTVDLSTAIGTGGASATGDTYVNIQDVTGTSADDTITASLAANNIDGGTSTAASHNRVSYAASVDGVGAAAGVTVNLITGAGLGGYAQGDVLTNIQDLTGSGAADTFVASAAANKFDGGAGNDTVDYSSSTAIIVNLSALTAGGVTAGTGSGGLANNDTYTNIENIMGGAGNDTFYAGTTANVFTGGGGTDTVSYVSSVNGVTASLLTGVAGAGGDAVGDTFLGITNLVGTAQNDTLTGLLAGGSTLDGGAGNDTLIATGGNNTLIGGTGTDTMTAGGDNNVFLGGASGDTMTGTGGLNNTVDYTGSAAVTVNLTTGAGLGGDAAGDVLSGIQNVKGSANADTFVANSAANVFTGNGGIDTVSYTSSATAVNASLLVGVLGTGGDAQGDSLNGITNLTGSANDDTLTGLLGGGSTLAGGAGNDILITTGNNNILIGGAGADTMSGTGTNNTARYLLSTAVVIDLNFTDGTGTSGGDAAGDKLSGIQNLVGGTGDDKFILNHGANIVDGGTGSNTVSYEHETTVNVTVDLSGTGIANGDGTFGAQDTLTNIQNAIGGGGNDIFIAGTATNFFDGGAGADTVSYANNLIGANASGVTVDLFHHIGSGNWAANDTYANIENVIGTAGNDTFIDAGDGVHNIYNGGTNGVGSNDTVSYQFTSTGGLLTIGLDGNAAHNTGNANTVGGADTFTNIANLTGSATVDTTIWGDGNANILTTLGTTNHNIVHGGGGADVIDGRLGGHNTLFGGATGSTIFEVNASLGTDSSTGHVTSVLGSNIDKIDGGGSTTTLDMHNLSSSLDISSFSALGGDGVSIVSHITTLDLQDKGDTDAGTGAATGTRITISSQDIVNLGVVVGGHSELTVKLDNDDSILLVTPPDQYQVATGTNDYIFYSKADDHEVAVLHTTH